MPGGDIIQALGNPAEWGGDVLGLASLINSIMVGRRNRVVDFAREVEKQTGYTPDRIGELLEDMEDLQELIAEAMGYASRATDERKRRLLARAAAAGITGDENVRVDDRVLFVRTLDQVEVPHIKLLVLLAGVKRTVQDIVVTGHWAREEILTAWPAVADSLDPLIAKLEGEALIRNTPSANAFGGGDAWNLTSYGARFVEFVRVGEPDLLPG